MSPAAAKKKPVAAKKKAAAKKPAQAKKAATRKKPVAKKRAPARKQAAAPHRRTAADVMAPLDTVPRLEAVETPGVTTFGLVDPTGKPTVKDPFKAAGLKPARALAIYRSMRLVRALDARMMTLQRQGRVGFYGACTGQEAVPLAAAEAMRPEDWIYSALREGSAMLHRGYDLKTYICQIFGNSGDALKGRNMPSHMADRAVNQVSWSSVIGPQISQAVGSAYAARLKGDEVVSVAFMGDGATSSADFHSGMNFAAVWQVPAVFVCQNNNWSISLSTERQTASASIAHKALAYGMPGYRVDGNDAFAVYAAVRDAVERARKGGGPSFLECVTYRIGAHSSSDDPRVYRDEREVDVWKQRDPVDRLQAVLMRTGHLTKAADAKIAEEATATVTAAAKAAEAMPPPARETLFTDVYAELPWNLREQRSELFSIQDDKRA